MKLFEIIKNSGKTEYSIEKGAGIKQGNIYQWKKGKSPSINSIIKLADYFNMSIDCLIGRDCANERLVDKISQLDNTERDFIERQIELLREKKQHQKQKYIDNA